MLVETLGLEEQDLHLASPPLQVFCEFYLVQTLLPLKRLE